jgi:hypothetical protein
MDFEFTKGQKEIEKASREFALGAFVEKVKNSTRKSRLMSQF